MQNTISPSPSPLPSRERVKDVGVAQSPIRQGALSPLSSPSPNPSLRGRGMIFVFSHQRIKGVRAFSNLFLIGNPSSLIRVSKLSPFGGGSASFLNGDGISPTYLAEATISNWEGDTIPPPSPSPNPSLRGRGMIFAVSPQGRGLRSGYNLQVGGGYYPRGNSP